MDSQLKQTIKDHQQLVLDTARNVDDREFCRLHAILGLCGEASELMEAISGMRDRSKLIDETGDVFWYAQLLALTFFTDRKTSLESFELNIMDGTPILYTTLQDIAEEIQVIAGNMADILKKNVCHGAPLKSPDLFALYCRLVFKLQVMSLAISSNVDEVLRHNITKLRKRYPSGFSTQASIVRADEKIGDEDQVIG
jgi:NTP pyrophosphatase (non-canonical NTP hydrolase)